MATIPGSRQQWHTEAQRLHIDSASVSIAGIADHDFASASKLKFEDWLCLRIIWTYGSGQPTHEAIFGTHGGKLRQQAEQTLSREPFWDALARGSENPLSWAHLALWRLSVNDIRGRTPALLELAPGQVYDDADPFRLMIEPPNKLRRNMPTKNYGELSNSTGSSASQNTSPPRSQNLSERLASSAGSPRPLVTRARKVSPVSSTGEESRMINNNRPDEALINMSLILLLQGVCMRLLQERQYAEYDWSILHKQFSVSHLDSQDPRVKTKIFTAKTDGCLQVRRRGQDPDAGEALAIVEVKPYRRTQPRSNTGAIQIQEGAEMAAWISTSVKTGFLPADSENRVYR